MGQNALAMVLAIHSLTVLNIESCFRFCVGNFQIACWCPNDTQTDIESEESATAPTLSSLLSAKQRGRKEKKRKEKKKGVRLAESRPSLTGLDELARKEPTISCNARRGGINEWNEA